MDFDSFASHPLVELLFHAAVAHVVVQHAHAHPFACLADQGLLYAATGAVVAEDVVLQVDVVLRRVDFPQQGLDLGSAVGIGRQAAAGKHLRVVDVDKQVRERNVWGRDATPLAAQRIVHRVHHQPLVGAARDDFLLAEVLSEKEIKDQPDHGSEDQDDHPGNGFQRVAVAGDDNQDDAQDGQGVNDDEESGQKLLHTEVSVWSYLFLRGEPPGKRPCPTNGTPQTCSASGGRSLYCAGTLTDSGALSASSGKRIV